MTRYNTVTNMKQVLMASPTLAQFNAAVQYKIRTGGEFGWQCFGKNAYVIDAARTMHSDANAASVIFCSATETVYQIEMWDYSHSLWYRWTSPYHESAFNDECDRRGASRSAAFDNDRFVDIADASDILAKITHMFNGEPYDMRVNVPVFMDVQTMHDAQGMAASKNMKLDAYMLMLLTKEMVAAQLTDGNLTGI